MVNRYKDRLYQEWTQHGKVVIGVDYDDTISPWKFKDSESLMFIDKTIQLLKVAKQTGAYIVIFTACAPDRHSEIKDYCKKQGLDIDSINSNPIELPYGKHGKIFANIFIDDRAGIHEALEILEDTMYKIRSDKNKINNEIWCS